ASRVDALSTAGSIKVGSFDDRLVGVLSSLRTGTPIESVFTLFPPTLDLAALAGDLHLETLNIFPSPQGTFDFFARDNVFFDTANTLPPQIALSDADPAFLPTIEIPAITTGSLGVFQLNVGAIVGGGAASSIPGFYSAVPTHSAARRADGVADNTPARIVASLGDVKMLGADGAFASGALLFSAKPVSISAGRDVLDLAVFAENMDAGSVSDVSAGRDITYSLARFDDGRLVPTARAITVNGPGQLLLSAGRNVDLQTSQGVLARGDLF